MKTLATIAILVFTILIFVQVKEIKSMTKVSTCHALNTVGTEAFFNCLHDE